MLREPRRVEKKGMWEEFCLRQATPGPAEQCWGRVNSTCLDFRRAAQLQTRGFQSLGLQWLRGKSETAGSALSTHGTIRARSVALAWKARAGCRAEPRADRDLNTLETGIQTGVD